MALEQCEVGILQSMIYGHTQKKQSNSIHSYRNAIAQSFVPLQITPKHKDPFFADIRAVAAGDVVFTEVSSTAQTVERTPHMISSGGSSYYKVSLLLSGTGTLFQDNRELVMHPGDLSVYDTSRPYSLLFDGEFRNLIMMFPKDSLSSRIPHLKQLTAAPLSSMHPLAPIFSAFISNFPKQLSMLSGTTRIKLADTSLDLVDTLFSGILGFHSEQHDAQQALLQQIQKYIVVNLSSTDLNPSSIAAAHYISPRYLHSLFNESETTVAATIKKLRLERCTADLVDPMLVTQGVAEIGARWGFLNPAHFSRIFRDVSGLSPTEFRYNHRKTLYQ